MAHLDVLGLMYLCTIESLIRKFIQIEILEIVPSISYRQDRTARIVYRIEVQNEFFANLTKPYFIIQSKFIQLCLYLGIKSGEFQRHGHAD